MTPASDRRREVADRLRDMVTPTWPTLTEAVMGRAAMRDEVVQELAELIDPTCRAVRSRRPSEHHVLGWETFFECSECWEEVSWDDRYDPETDLPSYCPRCGARIVGRMEDGDE